MVQGFTYVAPALGTGEIDGEPAGRAGSGSVWIPANATGPTPTLPRVRGRRGSCGKPVTTSGGT